MEALKELTNHTKLECTISLLIYLLHDKNKSGRAAAVSMLGKIGTPAVPALMNALSCKNWIVRFRSAEALGTINDARVIHKLIHTLDDENDHVRYMAAKGLGKIGDIHAARTLVKKLKDENEFVRKSAAKALGLIRGSESYTALLDALYDEKSPIVRDSIYDSLSKLKAEK